MIRIFNTVFIFLVIVISSEMDAQDYYSVIAENGLFIREEPDLNSKKIGKLSVGQNILLIENTKKALQINEGTQLITGEWYKVSTDIKKEWDKKESDINFVGYVFSGYLLKKQNSPKNEVRCDNSVPCNSIVLFDDFDLIIYNYQIYETIEKKQDTVQVYEYVFNHIGGKLLHIIPKKEIDSVQLSYTYIEHISEQFNTKINSPDYREYYSKNRVEWRGNEPFTKIKSHYNFFQMPVLQIDVLERFRKEQMRLRDTIVNLSGESSNVATLIYKEKPSLYTITKVILKIDIYSNNKITKTEYIEIDLSYGC